MCQAIDIRIVYTILLQYEYIQQINYWLDLHDKNEKLGLAPI